MQPTTLTRLLFVAALCGAAPMQASAQPTTDRPASLIVFPKVIADGTADTIIQIVNVSGSTVHAHCFYVNGAPASPNQPPGPANPPQWSTMDFAITLTRLQPTHWVASRGRLDDPTDGTCSPIGPGHGTFNCDGAGFDPGLVPALPPGFRGELLCYETDAVGAPISGDHLIGTATVQHLSSGDVAKYHAIGARGLQTNDSNGVLCLGGQVSAECPQGAEYDACPDTWILNHLADGGGDPLGAPDAALTTNITVVPCSHDLEHQLPQSVTLQLLLTNEFEQTFSASTTVTCWLETPLGSIDPVFNRDSLGGQLVQTRMRTVSGDGGFLVVAQTLRTPSGPGAQTTSSLVNVHVERAQSTGDVIRIPVESVQPEVVR